MSQLSILLTVILICIIVSFVVSFVVSYNIYKRQNGSSLFQKEDRYSVVVVKNGEEHTIAQHLTLEEAKIEQTYTNASTKIVKED